MNNKKLNNYILKLIEKEKQVFYQVDEYKLYLSDSYSVWIINKNDNVFNLERFKEVNLLQFFNDSEYIDGFKTNKLVNDGDKTFNILEPEEHDFEVRLDKKYLDLFNKDVIFKIKSESSPVLIYENENAVGLILPVRVY